MEEQKLTNAAAVFMDELSQWETDPPMNGSINKKVNGKIYAYFTPAIQPITNEYGSIEEGKCKPEHKVDGKVPFKEDIHFDGRTCDCGRVRFETELCGCDMKQYILKKVPNEG